MRQGQLGAPIMCLPHGRRPCIPRAHLLNPCSKSPWSALFSPDLREEKTEAQKS